VDVDEIAEAVWAYATRTLTAGVTLANGSITASAFDGTTAHPLTTELDERLSNCSTVSTTGAQIAALGV
jgi:hypothetical protein